MSQEPKKRHSRARQGKRRHIIHLSVPGFVTCANCAAKILPHTVCSACGYYDGKQVIAMKQPTHENS